MAKKAPGKSHRKGISLMELADRFPDEAPAREWFESIIWGDERCCGHCGSLRTKEASHKTMPYWCSDCRSYFSVKTGTALESSKLPLRKWAFAVYLYLTNLKGVSSMKLHRDIGVSQKTAWFMLHRIREAFDRPGLAFDGPVEVDETYIGGLEKNKHEKRKLKAGRGPVGKTAVVGAKDRETKRVAAQVVEHTDKDTLQIFVAEHVADDDVQVYTDDTGAYKGMPNPHEAVKHSVGEYVRGMAHTNGMESFWSMLKRGYMGVYHRMSPKHLQRYVNEFAGRQNVREMDTLAQMQHVVAAMVGRRLMYRDLVAPTGRSAVAG